MPTRVTPPAVEILVGKRDESRKDKKLVLRYDPSSRGLIAGTNEANATTEANRPLTRNGDLGGPRKVRRVALPKLTSGIIAPAVDLPVTTQGNRMVVPRCNLDGIGNIGTRDQVGRELVTAECVYTDLAIGVVAPGIHAAVIPDSQRKILTNRDIDTIRQTTHALGCLHIHLGTITTLPEIIGTPGPHITVCIKGKHMMAKRTWSRDDLHEIIHAGHLLRRQCVPRRGAASAELPVKIVTEGPERAICLDHVAVVCACRT